MTDRAAAARLGAALAHLLALARTWASSVGDARAREHIVAAEQALAEATQPDELVSAARTALALAAPVVSTGQLPTAFVAELTAIVEDLARRMELVSLADAARSLAPRAGGSAADAADVLDLVRSAVDAIAGTRRAHAVLDAGIRNVGAGLESVRHEEERAAHALSYLGVRVKDPMNDLNGARRAIVQELEALTIAASQRSAALERLERATREAHERAAAILRELAEATRAARTDALTGLGNRRAFQEAISLGAADQRVWSVLALDIDHFKRVNDSFGHSAGDAVLKHVAQLLADELRGDDCAFRCGGEEFVALLADCDGRGAVATAERVRRRIEGSSVRHEGHTIRVTVSIGAAEWHGGDAFEVAQRAADAALYEAKRGGRNRVAAAS